MITSTKFWITMVSMICVTVIEGILIWLQNYEFTEWYFGFMAIASGVFVTTKTYQNLSFKDHQENGENNG